MSDDAETVSEVTLSVPSGKARTEGNIIALLAEKHNADFFIYSAGMDRDVADKFLDRVEEAKSRENVALILSTLGGDPDAAYIVAKYLKRAYKKFTLYVFGMCKSAGTLLALGADEIVISERAEFGPLDMQLIKADEILFRSSGLDMRDALDAIGDYAFQVFEYHFIQLLMKSMGAITTRTAGEIATSIAVGILAPITEQINPLKLGEVQRSTKLAYDYGKRLGANPRTLHYLIEHYSSHSFVIDYDEAKELFSNIRGLDPMEKELEKLLLTLLDSTCIRTPSETPVVGYLDPEEEVDNEDETSFKLRNANSVAKDKSDGETIQQRAEGSDNTNGAAEQIRSTGSSTEANSPRGIKAV